jgi:hypothetical protein
LSVAFYIMPKLLSELDPNLTGLFYPGAILESPKLAAWLAVVINTWSALEIELGRSLTSVLHTQPNVGLAIYEGLYTTSARRGVLQLAARAHFGRDSAEAKVFCEILGLLKERAEDRNVIAHAIWGYSPQVPNALLRASQMKVLRQDVAEALYDPTSNGPMPPPFSRDDIEVFYEEDFAGIFRRTVQIEKLFSWFWKWAKESPSRDEWRTMLCSEPRIAKILSSS